MSAPTDIEGKSFEELLEMLEQTVNELDGDSLTLEQALATYERSVAISAACEKILDEAELRIRQIDARKPQASSSIFEDEEEYPF